MRLSILAAALTVMACGHPFPAPFAGPSGRCGIGGFGGTFQPVVAGANVELAVSLGRAASCPEGASLSELGTLSVVDSSGAPVAASLEPRAGSASAVFTPLGADTYRISVFWNQTSNGQETQTFTVVVADERPTTFLKTTFVDRMDNCVEGPFRTTQGLTLCGRSLAGGPLISVYGADGHFIDSFSASTLVVRGDSVWSRSPANADLVDLRVATATSLSLVGTVEVGTGGPTTEFETSGLRKTPNGFEFSTARFDGMSMTVTREPSLWPDPAGFNGVVLLEQGMWWDDSCHVISGCASMPLACEPVRQCLLPDFAALMSVAPDAAWFFSGDITMVPRPFEATTGPRPIVNGSSFLNATPVAAFGRSAVQQGAQAPALQTAEGVLLPQRTGQTFQFAFVRLGGRVMTVTKEFIVTIPDPTNPFVARFDRLLAP